MNTITYTFRGFDFNGFKFISENKYKDKYFENLLNEGSHYSKVLYRDALTEQTFEKMHIKLSYSIVFAILMLSSFSIAFMAGINQIMNLFIITSIIGIISLALFTHFKIRANEHYAGVANCKDITELIFSLNNLE